MAREDGEFQGFVQLRARAVHDRMIDALGPFMVTRCVVQEEETVIMFSPGHCLYISVKSNV